MLNDTAWLLATAPDATLRNGREAETLAAHAVELTRGEQPALLGTLAAAEAEVGEFDKAILFEEKAITLAEQQGKMKIAAALRAREVLLKEGKPLRSAH